MTKEKNYKEIIDRQIKGKIDKQKEYDELIVQGEEKKRELWVNAPDDLTFIRNTHTSISVRGVGI